MEELRISQEYKVDSTIAEKLSHSWTSFFGKHGRLTAVQRCAIPPILNGENVLVSSATATGKTEAACAPLVERNVKKGGEWSILYVCPTRALVNDLYYRLLSPIEYMGLRINRRTGEHRNVRDKTNVIVTTPESFDSLMCRGRINGARHLLGQVRAVVLDEIHLLHGSARGEMIRWLMARLNRFIAQRCRKELRKDQEIQIVALSATLHDPIKVLEDYLPGGVNVDVPGSRKIENVNSGSGEITEQLTRYINTRDNPEKILLFCSSRARVDSISAQLKPILDRCSYEICAHHGSLSQKIREHSESQLKKKDRVVCVATSTLELGVDIGDIDLVVLDGPPPDIASFMQRIGRGNRRTGITRVMCCSRNELEKLIFEVMLSSAEKGDLGPHICGPQYSVSIQQIASYIFQVPVKRARSRSAIIDLIKHCSKGKLNEALLDHLIQENEFYQEDDMVRLGDVWLDKTEMGRIHSVIEASPGITVVDRASGEVLASGVLPSAERGISVAGRNYDVVASERDVMQVAGSKDGVKRPGVRYKSNYSILAGNQSPIIRRYLNLPEETWPLLAMDNEAFLFHFGGPIRKTIVQLISRMLKQPCKVNDWYVELPRNYKDYIEEWRSVDAGSIRVEISKRIDGIERTLGRPYANKSLPYYLRLDEVLEWINLEEEMKCVARVDPDESAGDKYTKVLMSIVDGVVSKERGH